MLTPQEAIFHALKDKGPEEWNAYLSQLEAGDPTTGLSLLVVYPYTGGLAKKECSLAWANVAVRAAELEASNHSGVEREEAQLWAMGLRAWFISKMGSRSDDPILDKAIVLDWVLNGIDLSIQMAKAKAQSIGGRLAALTSASSPTVKQEVLQDLRLLRRLKNRLNVTKILADSGEVPADSLLHEWLKIREELP